MDALTTSTELKKWVAEGNLSAACLALQKFADETNYTELQQIAIQLQRRYNTCQQQIMQGVIAKSDADLEIARISQILLVCSDNLAPSADNQLLNLVNEQPGNTTKDERAAPQASNSKNFPFMFLLLAIGILALGWAVWKWVIPGNKNTTTPPSDTFELIVFAHGPKGLGQPITSGKIAAVFGNNRLPAQTLNNEGKAVFTHIPASYQTQNLAIVAEENMPWKVQQQSASTAQQSHTITVAMAPLVDTLVWRGTVLSDSGKPVANAQVVIENGFATTQTNDVGSFVARLPKNEGDQVNVMVIVNNTPRRNTTITLSGATPTTIKLNK